MIGVIEGDIRSLDYSSNISHENRPALRAPRSVAFLCGLHFGVLKEGKPNNKKRKANLWDPDIGLRL